MKNYTNNAIFNLFYNCQELNKLYVEHNELLMNVIHIYYRGIRINLEKLSPNF